MGPHFSFANRAGGGHQTLEKIREGEEHGARVKAILALGEELAAAGLATVDVDGEAAEGEAESSTAGAEGEVVEAARAAKAEGDAAAAAAAAAADNAVDDAVVAAAAILSTAVPTVEYQNEFLKVCAPDTTPESE